MLTQKNFKILSGQVDCNLGIFYLFPLENIFWTGSCLTFLAIQRLQPRYRHDTDRLKKENPASQRKRSLAGATTAQKNFLEPVRV